MADEPIVTPAPERRSSIWPLVALLIVALAALVVLQMRRPEPPNQFVGLRLPPLEVAGWLNAPQPLLTDDLRGSVVLIDFWQTDCVFCLEDMPKLVKLHQRFQDQGLKIVGLTPEYDGATGPLGRYVKSEPGLDWPIGYGAGLPFDLTGIQYTPTYILYDRTGRSVWSGRLDDAEDAIISALAKN